MQFNYKAGVCIFAVRTYSEYMSALYSLKRSCLFGELFFAARTGHRGLITYSYEQAEALIEYLKIHHRPIIYDDFGQ